MSTATEPNRTASPAQPDAAPTESAQSCTPPVVSRGDLLAVRIWLVGAFVLVLLHVIGIFETLMHHLRGRG